MNIYENIYFDFRDTSLEGVYAAFLETYKDSIKNKITRQSVKINPSKLEIDLEIGLFRIMEEIICFKNEHKIFENLFRSALKKSFPNTPKFSLNIQELVLALAEKDEYFKGYKNYLFPNNWQEVVFRFSENGGLVPIYANQNFEKKYVSSDLLICYTIAPQQVVKIIPKNIFLLEEIATSIYMLDYKDDWDDAGSVGYEFETWQKAIYFLNDFAEWGQLNYSRQMQVPNIFHGKQGGVDFVWETDKNSLLLRLDKNVEIIDYVFLDKNTPKKVIEGTNINIKTMRYVDIVPTMFFNI